MSGAEIGAALLLIKAAAEAAYYTMGALKFAQDLAGGFKHDDGTKFLATLIEQAKNSIIAEIQKAKLEEGMSTIDGAGWWWFRCQVTIQKC